MKTRLLTATLAASLYMSQVCHAADAIAAPPKPSPACLDKFCKGDVLPAHDQRTEALVKLNGQWYFINRGYGGYNGVIAFLWPSKVPANSEMASTKAPEFVPSGPGRPSNFYDVAIEIFLRSTNIPPAPHGYELIKLAQEKEWIAERKQLRPQLEIVRMKHVIGPRGYYIDHVTYYVATDLKGPDGLPPVATCNNARADGRGGTGFLWKPGIWVGTRMNQKHCADWPEIYQEVVRVLKMIRKADKQ